MEPMVQMVYLDSINKGLVVANGGKILEEINIGKQVKIRNDIDDIDVLDGFYLYEQMRQVLKNNPKITFLEIDNDTGFPTLDLDDSGFSFPLTVLDSCVGYRLVDIEELTELYDEITNIDDIEVGNQLRLKHNVLIGEKYGAKENVRYTPHQFSQYLYRYETHPFPMPGEVVTVVGVDDYDNTVLCEYNGQELWYGLDMLEKPLVSKKRVEEDSSLKETISFEDFASFISFVNNFEKQVKQQEQVPQVEVDDDLDIVNEQLDDDYDDFDLDFDDDYDYEDDLLDERYDGNRSPDYKFNFYSALEELKFSEETKQENEIWVMTNGERTFTFRDERLVSVRLADSVENFVYYSATLQIDDLDSNNWNWKIERYIDEETRKLEKLVEIIQTLKDENLALELLDIIQL